MLAIIPIKKIVSATVIKAISKPISRISMAGLMAILAIVSQGAYAAPSSNTTTIPLDMSGINITKHEIAVMQVLSEICPPMLVGNQKQRFYKSYNVQLHELMPSLEDPKAAIQYLSTQQDYRQILQSIRSWTMSFSKQDNRAICEDLANAEY